MKKSLIIVMLTSSALLMPAAANAQDSEGVYGSISATISQLQDTKGTIANAPLPGSTVRTENSFGTGIGGQAALGYDFGNFRLEGEIGFARDKQDSYVAIVPPTGKIPADVKQKSLRGMINAYADFGKGPIRPYVGAGVGLVRVKLDFFGPRAPFPTEPPRQLIKDSDTRFAYQLIGGLAVPVSERAAITLQYRWLDAGTIKPLDSRNEIVTRDHKGHNVDLGLRLNF